jgi:hypothetical protein
MGELKTSTNNNYKKDIKELRATTKETVDR